ncbi:nitronate monooxygenase [Spirosoma terrae]|nr:nitronate monooxygenase [Spirosoma terrae]
MKSWPDNRIQTLFGIELPIILAPMAGPVLSDMVIAVSEAGGLGSLPCALLTADQIRNELTTIRQRTARPINLNFFCHRPPAPNKTREEQWRKRLETYYVEFGIDPLAPVPTSNRTPFDESMCDLVAEWKPEVVSFHFGLPTRELIDRVKATGTKIMSSATTVDEARWLEDEGCDVIIAQGAEAGGHRGMFLSDSVATQVGTIALVPQVVDAVKVPVIAAGGIGDARGIVAAFVLGASAVQLGTIYMFSPEAKLSVPHREALKKAKDNSTAITNVFTGRPARSIVNRLVQEVGPMSDSAPAFPLAGGALTPLRAKTEPQGSGDFMSLWSGQAARFGRELPAGELTRILAQETLARLSAL